MSVGYIIGKSLYKALVDGGLELKPITYDTWELPTKDGVLNLVRRVVQLLDGVYRITIERGEASIGLVIDNVKTELVIKPNSGGYIMRSYVNKLEVGGTPLYNDITKRVAEAVRQLSRMGEGCLHNGGRGLRGYPKQCVKDGFYNHPIIAGD